jgi:hypothetical protein
VLRGYFVDFPEKIGEYVRTSGPKSFPDWEFAQLSSASDRHWLSPQQRIWPYVRSVWHRVPGAKRSKSNRPTPKCSATPPIQQEMNCIINRLRCRGVKVESNADCPGFSVRYCRSAHRPCGLIFAMGLASTGVGRCVNLHFTPSGPRWGNVPRTVTTATSRPSAANRDSNRSRIECELVSRNRQATIGGKGFLGAGDRPADLAALCTAKAPIDLSPATVSR